MLRTLFRRKTVVARTHLSPAHWREIVQIVYWHRLVAKQNLGMVWPENFVNDVVRDFPPDADKETGITYLERRFGEIEDNWACE